MREEEDDMASALYQGEEGPSGGVDRGERTLRAQRLLLAAAVLGASENGHYVDWAH